MKKMLLIFTALIVLAVSCKKDDLDRPIYDQEQEFDQGEESTNGNTQVGGGDEDGSLTLYRVQGNQITKVTDYDVSGELKPFQADKAKHQAMWDFVTTLIPLNERDKISEFIVFHGGGSLLGYVTPINESDLSKWRFGLAIDVAENLENINLRDEFTYTTIHEYGHVLTLNDDQLNVANNCNTYHTGEGCSNPNAYINKLYNLGWTDITPSDDPYETYEANPTRFVSEYAASNPGEDIAEVFTHFVINEDKPTGQTIADQKVRLLYDYPELVTLRQTMRANADQPTLARLSQPNVKSPYTFKRCKRKSCSAKRHSTNN